MSRRALRILITSCVAALWCTTMHYAADSQWTALDAAAPALGVLLGFFFGRWMAP